MNIKKILGILAAIGSGAIAIVVILVRGLMLEKIDSEPAVIFDGDRKIQVFQSESCDVNSVISGDMIACADGTKVKLCGIVANNNQASTAKLNEFLQGREINLSPMAKDQNPMVAEVFARISDVEEIFVNAEMVRSGVASPDSSQVDLCLGKAQILDAEKEAKGK